METVTAEELTACCRREGHAQLAALAHDAEVAPARVLPGQAQDEGDDVLLEGIGCCAVMARIGPRPGDRSRCQGSRVAGVTRKTPQRSRLSSRAKLASAARSAGE